MYMTLSVVFGILAYKFSEDSIIIGNLFIIFYLAITIFVEKKSLKLKENHES